MSDGWIWWFETTAKALGLAGAIGAVVYAALVSRLGSVFAKKAEVGETRKAIDAKLAEIVKDVEGNGKAIAGVEKQLAGLPDHDDMRELFRRLGNVEKQSAATQASVDALGKALGRIERYTEMLVENEVKGEKA